MTKAGEQTKRRILDVGVEILARDGLECVTVRAVARKLAIDHSNVLYYLGSREGLHDAVAAEAIARDDKRAIAQLIIKKHVSVDGWDQPKRTEYINSLID